MVVSARAVTTRWVAESVNPSRRTFSLWRITGTQRFEYSSKDSPSCGISASTSSEFSAL